MPYIISDKEIMAKVPHTCDYCGGAILPGEKYSKSVLKNGDIYTWNSHVKCHSIAQDLWDYADPSDGMTADDFQEACSDFCRMFICKDCEKFDTEADEIGIECDNSFCVDKIFEFLKTHDFKRVPDKYGYMRMWTCFPKDANETIKGGDKKGG